MQVYSIAIRTVAEAGGAALSASNSKQYGPDMSSSSTAVTQAKAAAWMEPLCYSALLLRLLLNGEAVKDGPDPQQLIDPLYKHKMHIRCCVLDLAAALLRCDVLRATSRLLAAEQHRGPNALLDMDTLASTVEVLGQLVNVASYWPHDALIPASPGPSYATDSGAACSTQPQQQAPRDLRTGDSQGQGAGPGLEQGPQQLHMSLLTLRLLPESGVLEQLCTLAVRRLAVVDRTSGLLERGATKPWQALLLFTTSLRKLVQGAMEQGSDSSTAAGSAVLFSPCLQVKPLARMGLGWERRGSSVPRLRLPGTASCHLLSALAAPENKIKIRLSRVVCELMPVTSPGMQGHCVRWYQLVPLRALPPRLLDRQHASRQQTHDLLSCRLHDPLHHTSTPNHIALPHPSLNHVTPQYLVHLHAVSQLHAVDGGATYGLPYDKLLPPMQATASNARVLRLGSGVVLRCWGLTTAALYWRLAVGLATPNPLLPGLGPREMLHVLLRTAQAAVDSWKHECSIAAAVVGGGGSGGPSSSGGGGQSTPQCSTERSDTSCKAILDARLCPETAVWALECIRALLWSHSAPPRRARTTHGCSSTGGGSSVAVGPGSVERGLVTPVVAVARVGLVAAVAAVATGLAAAAVMRGAAAAAVARGLAPAVVRGLAAAAAARGTAAAVWQLVVMAMVQRAAAAELAWRQAAAALKWRLVVAAVEWMRAAATAVSGSARVQAAAVQRLRPLHRVRRLPACRGRGGGALLRGGGSWWCGRWRRSSALS